MTSADQPAPVRVDEARLDALVSMLGRVGSHPDGGIVRPLYSSAWREAQDLVAMFMRDAGLAVHEDAVGNVFGRLDGDDEDSVLTGSHIDTVTHGGAYDGALGVLSGIAALEAAAKAGGRPRRPVEVVSLCEEEGSRFHSNFFGTRAILGMVEGGEPDDLLDAEGISLATAGRSVGTDPRSYAQAGRDDLAMFLELHIEQGRTLVDAGTDIGVVDAITGLSWLEVTVQGSTDHAGTTAMKDRRCALQGAAQMATAVEEVVAEQGHPAVGTVGIMRVLPGGANIVPGQVQFTVDLRHPSTPVLERLVAAVRERCQAVADARRLDVHVERVKDTPPHDLDEDLRALLRGSADACAASWRNLPSGAGHDSQTMATRLPTAMLFVPSVEGRSHSPAEYSTPASCALGASVLATTLRSLAW